MLTIRDGLQTRHIGPYSTPQEAASQLDRLLLHAGERARWQIHELEPPQAVSTTALTAADAPTVAAA